MNFQRFEGMGAAVGIVLTIMIITWLGLWGPINLAVLQQWQTLIAGCLAIIAACIAYLGSSSQARLNARLHREQQERQKLSLYLKMEFACSRLAKRARNVDASLSFSPERGDRWLTSDEFKFAPVPEIEEAWAYLDLFPRRLIAEIRIVRNSLREIEHWLALTAEQRLAWRDHDDTPPTPFDEIQGESSKLWQSAQIIIEELRPLIIELAPEMDDDERYQMLFGKWDDMDSEFDVAFDDHADTASRQP